MAKEVWKFELARNNTGPRAVTIEMPHGAEILSTGIQHAGKAEVLCMWARVTPGTAKEKRNFYLAFTGEDLGFLGNEFSFVGTYLCIRGELVMHLFEL